MTTISGKRKERKPKWYETPFGKFRLSIIVLTSKLPLVGKLVKAKYYHLPGVGNAKKT